MELYILSKQDLSILSICKLADYQINLDEETNAKSTFTLMKTNGLKKENYMVLNGLYRQFIFVIDDVQTEKESDVVTVTALDISNVFNRKVIEKNIDTMKSKSIEEFLANTISENFVNSDDTALNVNYIEIYWHTNTQGNVATNAENGLYNFHTFLTNCRQYKNIYTDFKLENLGNPQTVEGKRISLEAKNRKIVDISLHGESTQNGTPTPDNRVEIENIEGNIEFKVEGKNLFDKDDTNIITGKYINSEGLFNNSNSWGVTGYIKILPNKEYISWGVTSMGTNPSVNFYDKDRNYIGGKKHNTVNPFVFITPESCVYIRESFYLSDIETFMIEEGSEPTMYEPYKSQVVTFPLGEEKLMEGSYLADDGIHHKRKQVVLDGSDDENWTVNGRNQGYAIVIDNVGGNTVGNVTSSVLCDKLTAVPQNTIYNGSAINGVASYGGTVSKLYVRFDSSITIGKLLREKLAANPITVEYDLAEPETVPYTAEQQEAWDNIKNLTLFEGVNHISSNANMVLKYYPLEPVGLKFVLRIDIENKQEITELIDTTLPEVTDYNKVYEEDVTAKVTAYIRENNTEYNLYLKTDRTTTTNKNDPDRASGKIEVISVDTVENAPEEALNVMKGNNYKHLVEFKIAKTSKLMDITKLYIGRPIRIKTEDDIYDSYISALTLSDENFVYFKSGSLRITLLDKLKASNNSVGNKLDVTGGKILGNLNILDNAYFGKNGVAFGAPYDETQGGLIQFLANKYLSAGGAINMNNSDIINANCIYMNDEAEGHEGINFLKQGVSLGSTNQDDYECLRGYRGKLYYNENPVVDSGSNSNGTWVKWMDGTMLCYMNKVIGNVDITTSWGSMYETSSQISLGDYPQSFIETPSVSIMPTNTFFVEKSNNTTSTSWGGFWPCRPVSSSGYYVAVSCIAIGKWK